MYYTLSHTVKLVLRGDLWDKEKSGLIRQVTCYKKRFNFI